MSIKQNYNIDEWIYEIDKIGYVNYPYLIYKDLNIEVNIRSDEIFNEMKTQVNILEGIKINLWCDELLDAKFKAEYLYGYLISIDPKNDENIWIETKAWYEAIKKGLIEMENGR